MGKNLRTLDEVYKSKFHDYSEEENILPRKIKKFSVFSTYFRISSTLVLQWSDCLATIFNVPFRWFDLSVSITVWRLSSVKIIGTSFQCRYGLVGISQSHLGLVELLYDDGDSIGGPHSDLWEAKQKRATPTSHSRDVSPGGWAKHRNQHERYM